MKDSKRKQRGVASLFVMLMLIPTFAMVGLVTDVGWYYYTRGAARAAAEAGALAAVRSAMDAVNAGGSYSCASLGCQAASGCPESAVNLQAACQYATANGFSNSGKQAVTVEANITNPSSYAPGVQVQYYATVSIVQQNPLTFLGVLGGSSLSVGVRATAAVVNTIPNFCVAALNSTADAIVTAVGTPNITLNNCSMGVDSTSSTALKTSGSACISAASIQVVGGDSVTGCTTPSPITNVAPFGDPLYGLAAPKPGTGCDYTNMHVTATSTTLSPGNYCGGLSIASNSAVTFSPGTYNLMGGGLTWNGSSAITGTGVTFYNTCSTSPCNGTSAGAITMNGTGTVTLSAPTSGALTGILFFGDRTAALGGTETINGNNNYSLNGTLYFLESTVKYSGNSSPTSSTNTVLIADTVSFNGTSSSYFQTVTGSNAVPSQPTALLVQ